jgi:hypothetical protein
LSVARVILSGVYDLALRATARAIAIDGATLATVATQIGLPRSTVHRWVTSRTPTDRTPPVLCFVAR